MSCLEKINKILSEKKRYQELLEKINQKDFSGIEGTDDGYMRKFVEVEEEREYKDSEKLVIDGEVAIKVINGEIDVSNIKVLYFEIDLNFLTKKKAVLFFSKFENIKEINLGYTQLHKVDWGKDVLLEFARNPNIRSFYLGFTALHQVDWGKDVLLEFARNPNMGSFDLWCTELREVDWGKELLLEFARNPNLEYLHLGINIDIENLKQSLPEEARDLLKEEMNKEDLEKIREILLKEQD